MRRLSIGLISGTSQDGIDAVLLACTGSGGSQIIGTHQGQYPDQLRHALLAAGFENKSLSLREFSMLDRGVADAFARTALELIQRCSVAPADVTALGSHGQTIFHDPDQIGNTLQIGDPSRIAVRTGIPVVADFRRKDVALGGQGAPLVPAFHAACFGSETESRAVLNLGGIANLTLLQPGQAVRGFDTGPANGLMDEWIRRSLDQAFDQDGTWAASGRSRDATLQKLLADPYFRLPPPKSTGRGYFNLPWVLHRAPELPELPAEDVQSILADLTAHSVCAALQQWQPDLQRLLVCGGGAHNRELLRRIGRLLGHNVTVETTATHGIDPDWVEAATFAWLALRRLDHLPGALASVTGASRDSVLGGVFLPD